MLIWRLDKVLKHQSHVAPVDLNVKEDQGLYLVLKLLIVLIFVQYVVYVLKTMYLGIV